MNVAVWLGYSPPKFVCPDHLPTSVDWVIAEPTSDFCSEPKLDSNGDKRPFEELPLNIKLYCIESQHTTSLEAMPKLDAGRSIDDTIKTNSMDDIRFKNTPQ